MKIKYPDSKIILRFLLAVSLVFSFQARATSELDRQYSIETVGLLRSWDNVDGLFADYVLQAYKDYFSTQSRFTLQDLEKADQLLGKSKLPYQKVIEDPEILSQISKSMRVESLIRTKIIKDGPSYRFDVEWLHAPKMNLLSKVTFTMTDPRDGSSFGLGDVSEGLKKALDQMIKKIPFYGHITGRDNESVTVNFGANAKLKKGDVLIVATLDDVKKHPLLKEVVDWKFTQTGQVVIESVEEGIGFAKVIEEEPSKQINRYQKITRIIPNQEKIVSRGFGTKTTVYGEDGSYDSTSEGTVDGFGSSHKEESEKSNRPQYGWGEGTILIGNYSRQVSDATGTSGKDGGGTFFGMRGSAQVWLTKDWFSELGFGYGFASYSQRDIKTGLVSTAASSMMNLLHFKIDVGYNYYITSNLMGSKAYAKVGYHSTSYGLTTLTADQMGSSTFGGVFLGIGGDLEIRGPWLATLGLDVGVFNSMTETGYLSGSLTSKSDVGVFVGAIYRHSPQMSFRAGVDLQSHNADFANGANLTHRTITFVPALLYYF